MANERTKGAHFQLRMYHVSTCEPADTLIHTRYQNACISSAPVRQPSTKFRHLLNQVFRLPYVTTASALQQTEGKEEDKI